MSRPSDCVSPAHPCRRVRMLDAESAARIAQRVLGLRAHWRSRHTRLPFFTLGAASYLDAERGQSLYTEAASQDNPLLVREFGELQERVRGALAQALDRGVEWVDRFALPGFHVFGACPEFSAPFAAIHVDRQHRLLEFGALAPVDEANTLSITLPLMLPTGGAGLRLWDIDGRALEHTDAATRSNLSKTTKAPVVERYSLGEALVHDGFQLHQIAPMSGAHPGEWRITLQAHAALLHGRWRLYW